MTHWDTTLLLALANLVLCSAVGWTCLCRLSQMSATTTRRAYRGKYAVLVAAATASGFAPALFGEWPGAADLVMSAAVLLHLVAGRSAWLGGVPDYALTHRPLTPTGIHHDRRESHAELSPE